MSGWNVQQDIHLAQQICRQLREGNRDAILVLYERYQTRLEAFAKRRLYDPECWEDVLSDFWLDLLDCRIIGNYEGRNGASLYTYLVGILYRRIIDKNREIARERTGRVGSQGFRQAETAEEKDHPIRKSQLHDSTKGKSSLLPSKRHIGEEGKKENLEEVETSSKGMGGGRPREEFHFFEPVNEILKNQQTKLVHEILLLLEQLDPVDALLVRLRLEGYSYEEIMTLHPWLESTNMALRKRYSRAIEKFTLILQGLMERDGLTPQDLLSD